MELEDFRRERDRWRKRAEERQRLPRQKGGSVGTPQQTGDAETEDEGGLRAGLQAEGTRKWSVPRQQRRAIEATAGVDGGTSKADQ